MLIVSIIKSTSWLRIAGRTTLQSLVFSYINSAKFYFSFVSFEELRESAVRVDYESLSLSSCLKIVDCYSSTPLQLAECLIFEVYKLLAPPSVIFPDSRSWVLLNLCISLKGRVDGYAYLASANLSASPGWPSLVSSSSVS